MQPEQQRGGAGPRVKTNPDLGVHTQASWPWGSPRDFSRGRRFDFALFFCFLYHCTVARLYLCIFLRRCQPAEQNRESLQGETEGKNPTPFDIAFPWDQLGLCFKGELQNSSLHDSSLQTRMGLETNHQSHQGGQGSLCFPGAGAKPSLPREGEGAGDGPCPGGQLVLSCGQEPSVAPASLAKPCSPRLAGCR